MTQPSSIPARFELIDERFSGIGGDKVLQILFTGGRWLEGPAYFPAGRYLVFSDIPNDRAMRWDETTGQIGVFRQPSGYANGRTVDRQGRMISCEHGNRRVTRTEPDGSDTVLADSFHGAPLNSPNDVVERADGTVWFSDPNYGIDSNYEGYQATGEIGACHVYRLDPRTGALSIAADDFDRPNGLAFSLDEQQLYVTDTGRAHIRVFDVAADGALRGGGLFADGTVSGFDGIRLDSHGRLWGAAHDGLHCFDPDGTLIGKLLVPEICSNLTFGGPRGNDLFITGATSLYSIRLNVDGGSYPRAEACRERRTVR